MFGNYVSNENNNLVQRVVFEAQNDSDYTSANREGVVVVSTRLGRVYINDASYFANVPEIAWNNESASEILMRKMNQEITDQDIHAFQQQLSDLIDAEFEAASSR